MRISDWSSDVCSSDLLDRGGANRLKGFGIARLLGHACSETGEARQTADRQWRQRVLLYAGERAMTSENETPFEETQEMGDGGCHAGVLFNSSSRSAYRTGHQEAVRRGCGQIRPCGPCFRTVGCLGIGGMI